MYICMYIPPGWLLEFSQGPIVFASAMTFKILDKLENLTTVCKYVEIELPSVSLLEQSSNT